MRNLLGPAPLELPKAKKIYHTERKYIFSKLVCQERWGSQRHSSIREITTVLQPETKAIRNLCSQIHNLRSHQQKAKQALHNCCSSRGDC